MARARHRLRRLLKWCGFALSVFIVIAFTLSFWLPFGYGSPWKHPAWQDQGYVVVVTGGCVAWLNSTYVPSMQFSAFAPDHPWNVPQWRPEFGNAGGILPLWIPFLPVAFLTFVGWWRDRCRVRPGHCRCGYDLTGNTSGVCPECGGELSRCCL